MRRLLAMTTTTAMTVAGILVALSPVARADCPAGDGTAPGTVSRAYTVGVGKNAVYLDDRDFADYDGDNNAGGLWIYIETNNVVNLQRGGSQYAFEVAKSNGVQPNIPRISPVKLPTGNTLFPNGFGGGNLEETAGSHDDCIDARKADSIIF